MNEIDALIADAAFATRLSTAEIERIAVDLAASMWPWELEEGYALTVDELEVLLAAGEGGEDVARAARREVTLRLAIALSAERRDGMGHDPR